MDDRRQLGVADGVDSLLSERAFADTMIESMPGILYFYDVRGRFLRWNKNFERVSEYSASEIAHMHPLDFFPESEKPLLSTRIAEVFERGVSSVEGSFLTRSGKRIPYYFTGRRVEFHGKTCLVGVGIDISEKIATARRLQESEQKYRELVELANSIILRWNARGRILFMNEFGLKFFGYAPEEIVGRHVVGTIVPETETSGRDLDVLMEQICRNPSAFEGNVNENVRRNGERCLISWTNHVLNENDGTIEILSVGTDITEQQRAEEARRQSEARYRTLFEYAPDGILIADPQSIYLDANPAICNMLGYRHAELVGMGASDIVVPGQHPEIDSALSSIKTLGNHYNEWRFRRKNGTAFDAEVFATQLPDGNLIAMIRDITQRKAAESALRELNESLELRVAERTEELQAAVIRAESADRIKSAFLATMSHELRTPLNSIIGFTGILLQNLAGPLNAEQQKQLQMVQNSARHLLSLINDVLDISKIEAGQLEIAREPFSVRDALENSANTVRPLAESKGVVLRVEAIEPLGLAVGDQRRFEQVLLNLLSNAVKFTECGNVTIRAQRTEDDLLNIQVSDTGIGIRQEDLELLFQPFRQVDSGLARNYEGTGLGLAICHRLVTLMGGSISVSSVWRAGTTFDIMIPAATGGIQ